MRSCLTLAAGVGATLATAAHATILTFDQDNLGGAAVDINPAYGDRVTATTDSNNYGYLVDDEGFTPNIELTYGPDGDPDIWIADYGSLINVLIKNADSRPSLRVTLTADPGYLVQLYSFDMAAWDPDFIVDPEINFVRVLDSEDNELFRSDLTPISETDRTTFGFTSGPLTDDVIVIEFDAGNLGGKSDDIGIDNIRFGQVPEPSSLALLGLSTLTLARRRKRA